MPGLSERKHTDHALTATNVGATRALDVAIVDGSGNQVTTFGGAGGTASNFGSAFPSVGTAVGFKDSTGTNMAAGNLDASGNLKIAGSFSSTPVASATTALTNVAESASSVTVLASNANRLSFRIFNDSDAPVNFKCGAAASATSFTLRVLPRGDFSTKDIPVNYTGIITGIWDTTPGTVGHASARITEFTA